MLCRQARTLLALSLCLMLLLAGCGQASGESSQADAAAADESSLNATVVELEIPEDEPEINLDELELNMPMLPVLPETITTMLSAYSARDFVAGEVARGDLENILYAGNAAPSARNGQPWHFVAVTNAELVAGLNFEEGMALVVICGVAEEQEGVVVDFDCALATQNMYLAARALGYGSHIYTGPVRQLEEMRDTLGVPDGYDVVALLAIGHESELADATTSASERNDLAGVVTYAE